MTRGETRTDCFASAYLMLSRGVDRRPGEVIFQVFFLVIVGVGNSLVPSAYALGHLRTREVRSAPTPVGHLSPLTSCVKNSHKGICTNVVYQVHILIKREQDPKSSLHGWIPKTLRSCVVNHSPQRASELPRLLISVAATPQEEDNTFPPLFKLYSHRVQRGDRPPPRRDPT